MQIALVIAADQEQMQIAERQAILAAEDTDGDGFAVNHGEGLIGAAESSGGEGECGQGKSERSNHELHPRNLSAQRILARVF